MSDETTAPTTDTAAAGAIDAPPESAQVIDWEKRYNDLRPEFDRTKSTLSEVETKLSRLSDPESRAEVLAEYGLELEAEEIDTPEYDDPSEALAARLDAFEAREQQAQQAAQEAARNEAIADHILQGVDQIEQSVGRDLDEEEKQFIYARSQVLADDRGTPNVQAAWDALNKVYEARQQEWIKTKRAPGAPKGQSASKQPDLSNEAERAAYIDQRLQAVD